MRKYVDNNVEVFRFFHCWNTEKTLLIFKIACTTAGVVEYEQR